MTKIDNSTEKNLLHVYIAWRKMGTNDNDLSKSNKKKNTIFPVTTSQRITTNGKKKKNLKTS